MFNGNGLFQMSFFTVISKMIFVIPADSMER